MDADLDELVNVLREIVSLLTQRNTCVMHSHYTDPDEAATDLSDHLTRLHGEDMSKLRALSVTFIRGGIRSLSPVHRGEGRGEGMSGEMRDWRE